MSNTRLPNIKIDSFNFLPGKKIGRKYQVLSQLGSGWEGEVYKIKEVNTGVERAAKLFFPHRNIKNKISKFYAKKLYKLRHCSVLIHYHTEETIIFGKTPVVMLVSEFVEGKLLSQFLKQFTGNRLHPYQAFHLLYALVKGVEEIHLSGEYHGDLHSDNILVNHFGLEFKLKVVDMFNWASPKKENMRDDVCDLIQIFHESLGGRKRYGKLPPHVRNICCGLKRSLILKKFSTTSKLRKHLEKMEWGV